MSSTTNNNFSIEFDSGSISNIHTVSSNNNDNFSIEFASESNSSRNDEAPSTSNALAAVMDENANQAPISTPCSTDSQAGKVESIHLM